MGVQSEAVYLLNDEKYLHLRENTSGVGYATYDKLTLLPLEKGQIPFEHLPPDGRNAIPAARNWFLFELSDDPRKAIQLESIRILDNIPDSGIRKRRVWDDPSIPTDDVRLIDSNYKDLFQSFPTAKSAPQTVSSAHRLVLGFESNGQAFFHPLSCNLVEHPDCHTAFEKPSVVQLEQIFTIDKSRVQRFLGQLTQPEMYQIEEAISSSLNLNGG